MFFFFGSAVEWFWRGAHETGVHLAFSSRLGTLLEIGYDFDEIVCVLMIDGNGMR